VLRQRHVSPQFYQNSFHGIVSLPISKTRQLTRINLSISRVDTRQIDLGNELEDRRLVRVVAITMDIHTVDSVLVDALFHH